MLNDPTAVYRISIFRVLWAVDNANHISKQLFVIKDLSFRAKRY